MKNYLFWVCLVFSVYAFPQNESAINNDIKINRYSLDRDTSVYFLIRDFWKATDNLSYLTFPVVKSINDRKIDLVEREGKNGYKFETNINIRFPILQPRINSVTLAKISRITLDYGTNFRMTGDESSPLTPISQEVGLGVDLQVWNNKTKPWKHLFERTTGVGNSAETIKSLSFNIQAHHFSNGQPEGVFLYTADSTKRRNDYRQGDFSTNFVKISALYQILSEQNNLYSFKAWSRFDGDFFGFEFTPDQQYRYGQNRVGFAFDFYSKPHQRKKTQLWEQDGVKYIIKRLHTFHVQISTETILGKLHLFEPNLSNNSNQFRTNLNVILHYQPLSSRSIGFILKAYTGRDYLNIRYDDIIWTVQGGISVSLDQHYPFRWKSSQSIVEKVN